MPWDFWVIFTVLGVLIPWRGRARLRRLLSQPVAGTKEKLALYGGTIALQWLVTGLVAWRALARGLTVSELGFSQKTGADLALLSLFGAALLCTFQWFNLRRVGRMSGPTVDLLRKLAERLLPLKAVEFPAYCGLAVTAGVCEEFLYRGFAMAALVRAGVPVWGVVVITSILFGLAHAYQGRGGVIGTGLLGVVFGSARVAMSCLFPLVIWHAAVDVIAGLAGPRFLLNTATQESEVRSA